MFLLELRFDACVAGLVGLEVVAFLEVERLGEKFEVEGRFCDDSHA
jgi:hypothetical protein